MKSNKQKLESLMEALSKVYNESTVADNILDAPGVASQFTGFEKLFIRMLRDGDTYVSYDDVLDKLYPPEGIHDRPSHKIVDVFVKKINQKFEKLGIEYMIDDVPGKEGYLRLATHRGNPIIKQDVSDNEK